MAQQVVLKRFLKEDYVQWSPNEYAVIASDTSLQNALSNKTYTGTFENFAGALTEKLKKSEREISDRRDQARRIFGQLDTLEAEGQQENAELAAVRQTRSQLLASTQGEEDSFRQRFEELRTELEKQGIFARSARDRIGSRVWDDSGFYFNQLDSRWVNGTLGFSNSSTIGDYGCGVTSLAMVYKYYGINMNPLQLNDALKRTRAFVDDLLDWRNVTGAAGGRLALANNPYGGVDWGLIDQQLAAHNPVIVYINRGSTNHYVVLLEKRDGTYIMHDPIEGPYLRFSDHYRTDAVVQFITFRRT